MYIPNLPVSGKPSEYLHVHNNINDIYSEWGSWLSLRYPDLNSFSTNEINLFYFNVHLCTSVKPEFERLHYLGLFTESK